MLIKKDNGKGGFAIGTNAITAEKLAASGLTVLLLIASIILPAVKSRKATKSKKLKLAGRLKAKIKKNIKTKACKKLKTSIKPKSKKNKAKSRKSGLKKLMIRLAIVPVLYNVIKLVITQAKLLSLVKKIKNRKNSASDMKSEATEEPKQETSVTGGEIEVIDPTFITPEEDSFKAC